MDVQLVAQACAILGTFLWASLRVAAYIPYALAIISLRTVAPWLFPPPTGAAFYKGTVLHVRKRPKHNAFSYPVRMALIDLDAPPTWWSSSANDNMTAEAARQFAGTSGPVRLLTHPPAAGYIQNPISVYYCFAGGPNAAPKTGPKTAETLEKCIIEVTNTPWGERVTFVINPTRPGEEGEAVPKSLHVSPLMDMKNTWRIKAPAPSKKLFLSVAATHPEHGDYFLAALDASLDHAVPAEPNEVASFGTLLRYGFQPQRVAVWIYWQAVVLLWRGVSFYGPPGQAACAAAAAKATHPKEAGGCAFVWRPALGWPWRA